MKSVTCVRMGSFREPDPEKCGKVEVHDIPEQPLGDEDVKIKVAYCSICGSDPHQIEGIYFDVKPPFGLGHEVSGIITELGPKATHKGLKVGDRVAGNFLKFCGTCYYCQNGQQQFCEHRGQTVRPGMSEYIVWHESQVYKLPDSVGLKEGCLLEPLSIAVRVADKISLKIGQRVAVIGGGPIGLLSLQVIAMSGPSSLTLVEPIAERRALALKFGADHVIDPVTTDLRKAAMELTDGRGFDVVVDCSGSTRAVYDLPFITAMGGYLLYAAMYPNNFEMPLNLYKHLYANEITLSGVQIAPYAYPRAAAILPKMQLEDFTGKVFSIDDAQEAFKAHVSGQWPKILIECNKF